MSFFLPKVAGSVRIWSGSFGYRCLPAESRSSDSFHNGETPLPGIIGFHVGWVPLRFAVRLISLKAELMSIRSMSMPSR